MVCVASMGAQAQDCAGLKSLAIDQTKIESAEAVAAGSAISMPMGMPGMQIGPLPAFCKVTGVIRDRTGADGTHYGIRFELRLPTAAAWNRKFYFQGGGGLDGNLSPAIGITGRGMPTALDRGYAVVSDDGGHENPMDSSFGREQQARLDYAFESTPETARVARQLVTAYYGKPAVHAYFVGCSNGGREAMMDVERNPLDFDGAIAGDPGFRLTHAAIAEAWDTQAFLAAAPKDSEGHAILSKSFSNGDLKLVADAVLAKCDALDGLKDGEINNIAACEFSPAELICKGEKTAELPEFCTGRSSREILRRRARFQRQCALLQLALRCRHRRHGLENVEAGNIRRPPCPTPSTPRWAPCLSTITSCIPT